MFTCQKTYTDVPFAHRQHRHDGHCALIHGHNWSLTFEFGCEQLDDCGFVVDFGKLGQIKRWIGDNLDHACVFNEDDPMLPHFRELKDPSGEPVLKCHVMESCSSEGVAQHLFEVVTPIIAELTGGRAHLLSVKVDEDARNSASYRATSNELR
ncbi:MAG: 6-carboxytetrahydropterin synthase [Symploca sp. SIO2D2]|nr:6-carboxytetrahydropterin synthase [Symploca sp. SIO2D2]